MLDELSQEQKAELVMYFGAEPFGEVRADLRMAAHMQQRYDIARGRKGRRLALGEFVLYNDIADGARKRRGEQSLADTMERVKKQSKGRKHGN